MLQAGVSKVSRAIAYYTAGVCQALSVSVTITNTFHSSRWIF
jgi:hypothetical protein